MSTAAVLYLRVSTDRQAERDLSISAQRKALVEYAKRKGWTVIKEYTDEGESARTTDRPAFQQMLVDAKHRQFSHVLVWKTDRFARSLRDLLNSLDELAKHGVTLESLNEPMEDSPVGRFGRNALAGVAELFSATLAADVRRGMRESASRGNWVTSRVPLGFRKKSGSKVLEIDNETAPIVRRIYDLYLKGYGIRKIADTLTAEGVLQKDWHQFRVLSILHNEAYTGTLLWNAGRRKDRPTHGSPVRVPGAFPAIVDSVIFTRVQHLLTERNNSVMPPRTIASRFLLTGFTFCPCGGAMVGRPAQVWFGGKKHTYLYYVCRWWQHPTGKRKCKARMVAKDRAEQAVIRAVGAVFNDETQLKEIVTRLDRLTRDAATARKRATSGVDKQLQAAKSRLDKLYDALETGRFQLEDLAPRIADWRRKVSELEREKAEQEIASPSSPVVDVSALTDAVRGLERMLAESPPEEVKQVLRSVITLIELNADRAEIHWQLPLAPVTVQLPEVRYGPRPRKQRRK